MTSTSTVLLLCSIILKSAGSSVWTPPVPADSASSLPSSSLIRTSNAQKNETVGQSTLVWIGFWEIGIIVGYPGWMVFLELLKPCNADTSTGLLLTFMAVGQFVVHFPLTLMGGTSIQDIKEDVFRYPWFYWVFVGVDTFSFPLAVNELAAAIGGEIAGPCTNLSLFVGAVLAYLIGTATFTPAQWIGMATITLGVIVIGVNGYMGAGDTKRDFAKGSMFFVLALGFIVLRGLLPPVLACKKIDGVETCVKTSTWLVMSGGLMSILCFIYLALANAHIIAPEDSKKDVSTIMTSGGCILGALGMASTNALGNWGWFSLASNLSTAAAEVSRISLTSLSWVYALYSGATVFSTLECFGHVLSVGGAIFYAIYGGETL